MAFTSLSAKLRITLAGHHRHVALQTVTLQYLATSVRGPQPFPVYLSYCFLRVIANATWAKTFPTEIQINFKNVFQSILSHVHPMVLHTVNTKATV